MSTYDYGRLSQDENVVKLLRRAIVEGEQNARLRLQRGLGDVFRRWLREHPRKETACCLSNEEYYIAATFERFWQLASDQKLEFSTIDAVMPYLGLSLNGAVLDMLRTTSQPKEVTLLQPDFHNKQHLEYETFCHEVWEGLQKNLPNVRKQRLAYLLFLCGLNPREIIHHYSSEFSDVNEINQLRLYIMSLLFPC